MTNLENLVARITSFTASRKKEIILEDDLYPLTLHFANWILSGPIPYERIKDSVVRFHHPL